MSRQPQSVGGRAARGPLLGLAPIGKFVFSHEDAMRQKAAVESLLRRMGVRYVGIDDAVPDGMVRDQKHVDPVVRHLRSRDVDAVLTIPKGTLFPMCGMNLAFDRQMIGPAMYFGLMGEGQPWGR